MFSFSKYFPAQSLQEAYDELLKSKKNIILGGTSYLRMENTSYNTAIDLSSLSLDYIKEEGEYIHIGAMVSFREIETNPIILNLFDGILSKSVESIIGVQFRNNVTVGATVFSKYGFSDFIPALLSLDTTVVLFNGGEISLEEYLSTEGKTRDILVEIKIRKAAGKGAFQSIRKSKTDYAITNTAVTNENGNFRIAIGVRPGKAKLAHKAMELLNNSDNITDEVIDRACALITEEITFGSNMRGSSEYRAAISKVMTKRAIKEVL